MRDLGTAAGRRLRYGVAAFVAAAVVTLACAGVLRLTGHAIVDGRGGYLVTRTVPASSVRPGDEIVVAPGLERHRVVSVTGGAELELVTRAHGATARWTTAADGTVAKLRMTIPGVRQD
jgi:hypothetical protein